MTALALAVFTVLAGAAAHLTPLGRLVVEIGHNRRALEKAYPALDLQWPQTSLRRLPRITLVQLSMTN